MLHRFNISKHISISVLFFIISISCFVFSGFLKIIAARGGVLARFFCPGDRGFALSLCSGGGEFALPKKSLGISRGGGGDGQVWNRLIHCELLMSMTTSTSLTYKDYNTTYQTMSFPANFSPHKACDEISQTCIFFVVFFVTSTELSAEESLTPV